MNKKNPSLSVGVRGTLFGCDAIAAYIRRNGANCFQGRLSFRGDANCLIAQIDDRLSTKLRDVLPDFLSQVNADVSFGLGDNYLLCSLDTENMKFIVINLKNEHGGSTGSGFLCVISEDDGGRNGLIADLIKKAMEFTCIDNFFFYLASGRQPVDIGRLLKPFDKSNKNETIIPPAKLFNGGFCLYANYEFSATRGGILDEFLGKLLGIKSLAFFAGKDKNDTAYFALSLPRLSNVILSVEDLILKFAAGKKDTYFEVSGALTLSAVPEMRFALDCILSPERVMLSAAFVPKEFVKLIGDFYLGDTVLTIGYDKGLMIGILGEVHLRALYLFGAVQFSCGGVPNVQMISLATGKLTISSLVENVAGLKISGLEMLDDILCVDYFKFDFEENFTIDWFESGDIAKIVSFFNDHITSYDLRLWENYAAIKKEPRGGGYYLTDKYRMRHYYVKSDGSLSLCPQFYYSDIEEELKLPNGMTVSAGIFFCAKISVFKIFSIKVLFSFRPNEGALAFGMLSEIDLGIIKISSSDFEEKDHPIRLPKDSALRQFLDLSTKGVVFFLQMSANETSFYFDGMFSIAGILKCQARLFYEKDFVSVNAESMLCGMRTKLSIAASYRDFNTAGFSIAVSFDTYELEEKLDEVKKRLTKAIEACRKKIHDADRSLEDAKIKVRKLYGEIDVLRGKVDACRNRLKGMSWWKKIFWAPIIGCEIAGLEIAMAAIRAAIAIAEAALTVAQAAVRFVGTLGVGVLQLVYGVIDSVTSLFFIRKLEAIMSADVNKLYMELGIEFVALGKEYNYKWSVKKELMQDTKRGHDELSGKMLYKMDSDLSELEKGVVSSTQQMDQYANVEGYFEQPAKISDAAAVLDRNAQMTSFIQNAYIDEFGEEPPDFDEMNAMLLENIGVIEANIDVSKRAVTLTEMNDTVDKLRGISMTASVGDRNIAAEAVEKYENAVELFGDMKKLLGKLDETYDAICFIKDERSRNAREAVRSRGINGEQYRCSMYEYAKSVHEMMESAYKDLPQDGYINLWEDEEIRNTVLRAEEYFKANSL